MRETAGLQAQQQAAAMDLGRQSTLDMLSLQGQRVNTLGNLSAQAFANQSNLFNMNQNLFNMDLSAAGYENSRGGGLKGAISGALTGAGAGLQFATGLGNITNAKNLTDAQVNATNAFAKQLPAIATNVSQVAANMTSPSVPAYLQPNAAYSGPGYTNPNSPLATGQWFNLNDTSFINQGGPRPLNYTPPQDFGPVGNVINSMFGTEAYNRREASFRRMTGR